MIPKVEPCLCGIKGVLSPLRPPVVKGFQEYSEPEAATPGSPQRRTAAGGGGAEDEGVLLPLGENVLTHNLGIPVLIVCTKVSGASPLLSLLTSSRCRVLVVGTDGGNSLHRDVAP